MRRKIIKFIKCLIIIISLFCTNIFAAISVSDGSAFVTKTEFSSKVSSLSNRMDIVENSIDAKIDSLVSSYLSRNGIWSGLVINHASSVYLNLTQNTTVVLNDFMAMRPRQTVCTAAQVKKSGLLVGSCSIDSLTFFIERIGLYGWVALELFGVMHQKNKETEFSKIALDCQCIFNIEFAAGININARRYRNGDTSVSAAGRFNMTQNAFKIQGFVTKDQAIFFDLFGMMVNKTGPSKVWRGKILDGTTSTSGFQFATYNRSSDTGGSNYNAKLNISKLTIY